MPDPKVSVTTKAVAMLLQLQENEQLKLQPEFQREGIWPKAAKSYFIDSILNDRPIPPIYLQRVTSVQTGRTEFAVIDGQQRLRAVAEFIKGDFALSELGDNSIALSYKGKKFPGLPIELQHKILNFDFVIQELSGYTDKDIRDIFTRMNKYVVRLSKQELRHAHEQGKFKDFVERMAGLSFWRDKKIFNAMQIKRMRAAEFAAELVILLIEGPQNGKTAVDMYYQRYSQSFGMGSAVETLLKTYLAWIERILPDLAQRRYRRSNELYSLIGAMDLASQGGKYLSKLDTAAIRDRLLRFEADTLSKRPRGDAAEYVIAASKHTDDLVPRVTRISIIEKFVK
jgi:hypothetical protein